MQTIPFLLFSTLLTSCLIHPLTILTAIYIFDCLRNQILDLSDKRLLRL